MSKQVLDNTDLQIRRMKLGLNQKMAAAALGITPVQLADFELQRKTPLIFKIATLYGCTAEDILADLRNDETNIMNGAYDEGGSQRL